MKERPIIFSGPMVRAILDGRKTMTRRVLNAPSWFGGFPPAMMNNGVIQRWGASVSEDDIACPYGQPGDRLWVRETWGGPILESKGGSLQERVLYRQGDEAWRDHKGNPARWHPSIFMPRCVSRLTLETTAVRVERLQDISEEDAKAEGAERLGNYGDEWTAIPEGTFRIGYRALWDSLNAKRGYGWDMNPWVWVITFRRAS